jgi:uncharacterized protein YjlB
MSASKIDRRTFAASLLAAGVAGPAQTARTPSTPAPEQLHLRPNGWMPNNPLPVLLYRAALPLSSTVADHMEQTFTRNGWPPQWRNGVFDFHHFHSTAHEVLGFAAGHADLILGGEQGTTITVRAGDVAILPAGTGHCRLSASADFLVIGAYPPNQHWDICRSAPTPEALARMRRVSFPASDPVTGASGPLTSLWTL